jgi:CheY-like chemotaxis protein
VLVVDDDESVRTVLALLVQYEGFEVEAAVNGQAGLAAFSTAPFDVVFVDLRMPRMNGLDMAAAIRRTDSRVPIVLITAEAGAVAEADLHDAGITRVLAKPFTVTDVVDCLRLTRVVSAVRRTSP